MSDISEQFIKMCDRNIYDENIQSLWVPKMGDLFYVACVDADVQMVFKSKKNSPYEVYFLKADNGQTYYHDRVVWLPRQDQLQDMVKECPFNLVGNLIRWIDKNITYSCGFDTMEQLWLAFVMKEKFNKTWDGKKWIK